MDIREKNGRFGVAKAELICLESDWYFREQPISDKGVDAIIEFINDNHESTNLVALQIKSGKSYLQETADCGYWFRFDENHKMYWDSYALPVVIVLDKISDNDFYCVVYDSKKVVSTGKDYKIRIADSSSFAAFLSDEAMNLKKLPKQIYNYNYMITQLPIIDKIKEGYDVILKAEEWINKSSGRGHIYIDICKDGFVERLHWNFWFPFQMYSDVFKRLFPWATFEVDQDFVKEYDKQSFNEKNFYRFFLGKEALEFGEYLSQLDEIRGVVRAGEVEFYKIHLGINDFGNAFYLTHKTLSTIDVYEKISISSESNDDLIMEI